jgi:hypothetical protein
MAQWTLTDNSTGSSQTMTFTVNPNSATYPGRHATLTQNVSLAPAGGVILFQGRDQTRTMTFSGVVITEAFYNLLNTWMDKWYPLILTDDQGSEFDVIIESWEWTRVRRALRPWRFDYEARLLVI